MSIHAEARLYAIGPWTIFRLPKTASAQLPSRGQVMVKGTFNGTPLHTALEPDGNGSHWLNVGKTLQATAHTKPGATASLAIEPTKDWPEPEVPADIKAALRAHPDVKALWQDVTPMARWEWIRWINSTGRAETRQRRIDVACSKLRSGLRRPCCFNRSMCCVPEVSKNGVLLEPTAAAKAA